MKKPISFILNQRTQLLALAKSRGFTPNVSLDILELSSSVLGAVPVDILDSIKKLRNANKAIITSEREQLEAEVKKGCVSREMLPNIVHSKIEVHEGYQANLAELAEIMKREQELKVAPLTFARDSIGNFPGYVEVDDQEQIYRIEPFSAFIDLVDAGVFVEQKNAETAGKK